MGFHYEKIGQTLRQLKLSMLTEEIPLENFLMKPCGYKQGNELPFVDDSWIPFKKYDRWGNEKDSHCWFYSKITTNHEDMYFNIKTGSGCDWGASNPQFIIYVDGVLVQGMDENHSSVLLSEKKEYEIYLYAYAGMKEGLLEFRPSLISVDKEIEKLYYHLKVPYDICTYLQEDEIEYIRILEYMVHTCNLIDFRVNGSKEFLESIRLATEYIEKEFYNKYCDKNKNPMTTICIGHTHIDVAWQWTLAQTKEKVLRSFSTVINLMKQYPEYKFMSSQAQLYEYLKEESPELYEEVKQLVRQGRWEVEGAMWVEADCNLTSGESLVRQILFGKRFFKQEFDVDSHVLWLPDVFGYSAALPQILIKSGVNVFLTSKISWNETNTLPNDTFIWQGIDGTEIFSYFLTTQDKVRNQKPVCFSTYNGILKPSHVAGTWDRYQNKEINNEVLLTFGYGDGGGGPTSEMLESARRLEKGIPGCPNTKIDTVSNFFQRVKDRVKDSKRLPKWIGELYLEFHRGTYTSQAKNKKYNRNSEFLYQAIELFNTIDMITNQNSYPQEKINQGWKTILLNQFHDIIPGSSIREVYEDSIHQYEQLMKDGYTLLKKAYDNIVHNINTDGGVLVFNPLPFKNSGTVRLNDQLVYVENIPAKGYAVVPYSDTNNIKVDKDCIENKFFCIKFSNGDIISIFDKANNREVVKPGYKANVLQAFEDYPKAFDAWELTDYYKEKMWVVDQVEEISTFTDGVMAGIEIKRRFLDSVIIQKICLYEDIARIDFDTYIDWKQDHIILKALFPVDVHADKATYDIQFGTVERATHQNTSWDKAKFEVCAHKFADISEDDYGVSLLNDCKYGYDIVENDMRLTLLKSATHPDPLADKCEHRFTYSLYPHKGNHKQAGTVQMAYNLNVPMYATVVEAQTGALDEYYSLVNCDKENIMIDTVKKAEDSDAIVVRMYETYNRRTDAMINFGFNVKQVYVADLMENPETELEINDNSIVVNVKPFEIVTLLVSE